VAKQTITQRQFLLGQIKGNFLEAKDLEIRGKSLQASTNVRPSLSGTMLGRMGTDFVAEVHASARVVSEIRPRPNLVFGVIVSDTSIRVVGEEGDIVWQDNSVPWSSASSVWIEPFREETIIGHPNGLHTLTYEGGTFVFDDFEFDDAPGGELAQPYWAFRQYTFITPSNDIGSITVTASQPIFTSAYVGMRLRYHFREFQITGYTNPTTVTATVIERLPPTFNVTVANSSGMKVGDSCIGLDSGFEGVITGKSGATLTIATIQNYDGPSVSEDLAVSDTTSKVQSKVKLSALAGSFVWDEPLISPIRGYPRAGRSAGGRMWFIGFDDVPSLVCGSSARGSHDFEVGDDPDDAILRKVGDNDPRFLHVENAGDLILFSDRGLYYVPIRETKILTPANFQAIRFDSRSSSNIKPAYLDDGLIFVEGNGQTISACLLNPGVYTKWSVRSISIYHDDVIRTPVRLCGPSLYSTAPEKYLFIVNSDGTMAAMSWVEGFNLDTIGFNLWTTLGQYIAVAPLFGGYYAIVDRSTPAMRCLEVFREDAFLDCQWPADASAGNIYAGASVAIYGSGFYGGVRDVTEGGVTDTTDMPAGSKIGRRFTPSIQVWPAEVINHPKAGLIPVRTIRGSVDVRGTGTFSVTANNITKEFGGLASSGDPDVAPPLLTAKCRFMVSGDRGHPVITISKKDPGPYEVLAVTQEVRF
jgi:hypothetical protein